MVKRLQTFLDILHILMLRVYQQILIVVKISYNLTKFREEVDETPCGRYRERNNSSSEQLPPTPLCVSSQHLPLQNFTI